MGSLSPSFRRATFELFDGQRTSNPESIRSLPDLIRFNALNNPEKLFAVQAKQSSASGKDSDFVEVKFRDLAESVEQCCSWILENIQGAHVAHVDDNGKVEKSKPIALLLESDLTLFIYLAALLTLNIPCLLLSIRLHGPAINHLLQETNASSIIVSPRTRASLESDSPFHAINALSFEGFLPTRGPREVGLAYLEGCRGFIREDDRNVIVLHSSGTTGMPKAIPLSHRYMLGYAGCHEFPLEQDMSYSGWNLSTLPLFHGFGVLAPSLALSVGKTVLFPPSTTIPNGSLVVSILKSCTGRVTSLMTVPTILEDVTLLPKFESDAAIELARLHFIAVGGGGIKISVGSKLSSLGVTLLNHFGATELGALAPIFQPELDYDWKYLRLRKDLGLTLEEVESDDPKIQIRKLIGYPFAWGKPFELQDRLEANPLKPFSEVKILGRNDDLLVLATGEKVLPHAMEQKLESHPLIRRAVVFGNGQFEVGVLLEPFSNVTDPTDTFVDKVWDQIVAANELMDSHARISSKNGVLVKSSAKNIPLTDKGSVRRKEVYEIFAEEIAGVYSKLSLDDENVAAPSFDVENPEVSIRAITQGCLPPHMEPGKWTNDSDFIALGMDSLQATKLRRTLRASLRNSGLDVSAENDLPLDIIYSHPSATTLSAALKKWLAGTFSDIDPAETMQQLFGKYSFKREQPLKHMNNVILITGTTGNLGAHLLELLVQDKTVRKVLCLIRSPSSQAATLNQQELFQRQVKALSDRGIALDPESWEKIEVLPWVPGADHLGQSEQEFQKLATSITHIFHGAWPMDFKLKVQSLEPHIKTVKDLIDLGRLAHSTRPALRPRVVLASSIAVVGRYSDNPASPVVPEVRIKDPKVPLPIGYAEAKWVCEKIMESAFDHIKEVEPVILRIGQLTGSTTTGYWSSKEHFPALVKAAQAIGAMPNLQGTLSWIPVDRAARVSKDILMGSDTHELVYHLENPVRQSWPHMCTVVEQQLSLAASNRLEFSEWLRRFSASKEASQELTEFFQHSFLHMSSGALILDTTKAREASYHLRCSGDVDMTTVGKYFAFWRSIGFLK